MIPFRIATAKATEWPSKHIDSEKARLSLEKFQPIDFQLSQSLDVFDARIRNLLASLDPMNYGIKRVLASDGEGQILAELVGDELEIGQFTLDVVYHGNE